MQKSFKNLHSFDQITQVVALNHLCHILSENRSKLLKLAESSHKYYSPFIDGSKGKKREVDQPKGKLKDVQTKILDRILKLYPLDESVVGAVPGFSPKSNAYTHKGKTTVVRIDLSDCFHSVKSEWVYYTFRHRFHYSVQVSRVLTKLCVYKRHVPVGSPLSSMLVNIVLNSLWEKIRAHCEHHGHTCSVWVDDLVISGEHPEKLVEFVKSQINARRLKIGWRKLLIQRSNKPQLVTGCVVNRVVGLPKEKKLKYAKTMWATKKDPNLMAKAKGQLAFALYVNSNQGNQLKKILQ